MVLQAIGERCGTDKATFHKYLDFYEANLPDRSFAGRLLEIGIMDGYSLAMWREYYPDAEIIGIDIHNKDHLSIEHVAMLEIDATDTKALSSLGSFDIIIDDGSHMTLDQQVSFFCLYYNQLSKDGVYIIEDIHTSLMPSYINSDYTTIEMLERLQLDVNHYRRNKNEKDSMTVIIKAGQ